jgi:hypothetical protein
VGSGGSTNAGRRASGGRPVLLPGFPRPPEFGVVLRLSLLGLGTFETGWWGLGGGDFTSPPGAIAQITCCDRTGCDLSNWLLQATPSFSAPLLKTSFAHNVFFLKNPGIPVTRCNASVLPANKARPCRGRQLGTVVCNKAQGSRGKRARWLQAAADVLCMLTTGYQDGVHRL